MITEHVNCNLYGSKEHKIFKKINDYQLAKCKQCGLVYLNPRPSQQKIKKEYFAEYHVKRLL